MKIQLKNKSSEEIFKLLKLKETSMYSVMVKVTEYNLEHSAVLFTGFKIGSYNTVYNGNYEHPVKLYECYEIEVLGEMFVQKKSKIKKR